MIGTLFREIAAKHGLTTASGMAYGLLNGCFVTLSAEDGLQRISIYVGPQEQPAPGYTESQTVSCARQICHAISTASGPDNLYSLMTGSESIPALVLNHAGSVVTVNFPDIPEARTGIERFIAELLPQVAPLTRPGQCIFCCQMTSGAACPVRLSADTVVPMHAACHQKAASLQGPTKEEQAVQHRAIAGAACGALVGAIIWALLSGFGPIAWISGVLMGLLPTLAYDFLKGQPDRTRIVTILICAAAAVLLGSAGAALLEAYGLWMDELRLMNEHAIGFPALAGALLTHPGSSMLATLLKSLIAGFIFAAIGCIGCFRKAGDAAAATANAEKLRRLKGRF